MNNICKLISTLSDQTVCCFEKPFQYRCITLSIIILLLSANITYAQPHVKVWGSKNPKKMKKQAEIFLEHLEVRENLHLTIGITTEMPEKLEGITIPLPSPEPDMYQMLKVLIEANLSKEKQLLVLAHEMIHVKQYAKNELKTMNDKRVVWKGKKHYYSRADNLDKPWEKEAYRNDHILAQLDIPLQNPLQKTLAEQIPNRISNSTSYKCSYVTGKCKDQKTNS